MKVDPKKLDFNRFPDFRKAVDKLNHLAKRAVEVDAEIAELEKDAMAKSTTDQRAAALLEGVSIDSLDSRTTRDKISKLYLERETLSRARELQFLVVEDVKKRRSLDITKELVDEYREKLLRPLGRAYIQLEKAYIADRRFRAQLGNAGVQYEPVIPNLPRPNITGQLAGIHSPINQWLREVKERFGLEISTGVKAK